MDCCAKLTGGGVSDPNPRNAVLFLIALNYKDTKAELFGTDDDIVTSVDLLNYLIPDLNYKKIYIGADTEESAKAIAARFAVQFPVEKCVYFSGTKENIENFYAEALANMSATDDFMWCAFSGHGTGVKDHSGDEPDGKDEAFYTYDKKVVVDDDFRKMVDANPDKKVINFFDCCHSGTILDLTEKHENVVSFCACQDEQVAAEVEIVGDAPTGVMTMNIEKLAKQFDTPMTFLFMSYGEIEDSLDLLIGKGMGMQQLSNISPKTNPVNMCLGRLMYKNATFIQQQIARVKAENVVEKVKNSLEN